MKKQIKVKGYAIVWKENGVIEEAFEDFEMNDTFSSLQGARMYVKKVFSPKNGWKKGYFNKDLKIVPCVISYKI